MTDNDPTRSDRIITADQRLDDLVRVLSERLVRPDRLTAEDNDAALAVPLLLDACLKELGFDPTGIESQLATIAQHVETIATSSSGGGSGDPSGIQGWASLGHEEGQGDLFLGPIPFGTTLDVTDFTLTPADEELFEVDPGAGTITYTGEPAAKLQIDTTISLLSTQNNKEVKHRHRINGQNGVAATQTSTHTGQRRPSSLSSRHTCVTGDVITLGFENIDNTTDEDFTLELKAVHFHPWIMRLLP